MIRNGLKAPAFPLIWEPGAHGQLTGEDNNYIIYNHGKFVSFIQGCATRTFGNTTIVESSYTECPRRTADGIEFVV